MEFLDLPLREQAAAIAAGDADPSELLDAALARIEERNPAVNAIVETFEDESRRMLAEAPRGPLYGVPVTIKDEWPLPWRAERLGAAQHIGPPPQPGECGPYRALRDAGAVIVGVANMHEYGSGSTGHISAYGPARNPWDTERCPGRLVQRARRGGRRPAGRAAPWAPTASGSIRYPAAYCGLTGLKPTFGRSTMLGHHVPQTTTIVSGPLCRDAADCRLLGGVLFGEVLGDSQVDGMRIGVVPGELWDDCEPAVVEACREALDALREATGGLGLRGRVRGPRARPDRLDPGRADGGAGARDPGADRGAGRGRQPGGEGAAALPDADPGCGDRQGRCRSARWCAARWRSSSSASTCSPGRPSPPPPPASTTRSVELPSGTYPADYVNPRQGGIANLAGVPAISVPVGRSPEGLPMGLQLIAAWGRDELLLDAAEALERANERRWVDAAPALASV